MVVADEANFKVERLTADNYYSWKFNMKMYLIGKDLWDIVNGTEVVAHDADDADKRKFKKRENMALATVCLSVSQSLQIYVRSAKTSEESVGHFRKTFSTKHVIEKNSLSKKAVFCSYE